MVLLTPGRTFMSTDVGWLFLWLGVMRGSRVTKLTVKPGPCLSISTFQLAALKLRVELSMASMEQLIEWLMHQDQ